MPKKDVVVIINTRARQSQATKEFISIADGEGFIKNISDQNKEKSYVVTVKEIFISPISCTTLKKRSDHRLEV